MNQELLTVPEAADRLRIKPSFAWALIASGELESIRIGRLRRIPPTAIEAFIANKVAQSAGGAL